MSFENIENVRLHPESYIGPLGDGTASDDGIYFLIMELLKGFVAEFSAGFSKVVHVDCTCHSVRIRDYGRCVREEAFRRMFSDEVSSVRFQSIKRSADERTIDGTALVALAALSESFEVCAWDDETCLELSGGSGKVNEFVKRPTDAVDMLHEIDKESGENSICSGTGLDISFRLDGKSRRGLSWISDEIVGKLLRDIACSNKGLEIRYRTRYGKEFRTEIIRSDDESKYALKDIANAGFFGKRKAPAPNDEMDLLPDFIFDVYERGFPNDLMGMFEKDEKTFELFVRHMMRCAADPHREDEVAFSLARKFVVLLLGLGEDGCRGTGADSLIVNSVELFGREDEIAIVNGKIVLFMFYNDMFRLEGYYDSDEYCQSGECIRYSYAKAWFGRRNIRKIFLKTGGVSDSEMKELSDNNFLVLPREKLVRFLNENPFSNT